MRSLFLCLAATLFGAAPAAAQLVVVTSLPDLAALVAEVGGDQVKVTSLALATEDPHFVDARPSFLIPLSQADLFVANGLDLEVGWVPPLLVSARNPKIQPGGAGYFDASSAVKRKLEVPHSVDPAHGDVHAGGNPHYTADPRAAAEVVEALGAKLGAIDPANAAAYTQRATECATRLRTFAAAARARFAALSATQRRLVTYHRSWAYLLDWLDLKAPIEIEPRPGIPPTPAHTARVVTLMRGEGIKVVLQEAHYPRKTSETLARLAGARLVVVPAQAKFAAGQRYLERVEALTNEVYDAMAR